jgi:hypothetical protein
MFKALAFLLSLMVASTVTSSAKAEADVIAHMHCIYVTGSGEPYITMKIGMYTFRDKPRGQHVCFGGQSSHHGSARQ